LPACKPEKTYILEEAEAHSEIVEKPVVVDELTPRGRMHSVSQEYRDFSRTPSPPMRIHAAPQPQTNEVWVPPPPAPPTVVLVPVFIMGECSAAFNSGARLRESPESSVGHEESLPCSDAGLEESPKRNDAAKARATPCWSKGSAGHPYTCAKFCKYAKKARGCKDGADCDRCHLCTSRDASRKQVDDEGQTITLCSMEKTQDDEGDEQAIDFCTTMPPANRRRCRRGVRGSRRSSFGRAS